MSTIWLKIWSSCWNMLTSNYPSYLIIVITVAKAMNLWQKTKSVMLINNKWHVQIAILISDLYTLFLFIKTAKWSFIDVSCIKYIFYFDKKWSFDYISTIAPSISITDLIVSLLLCFIWCKILADGFWFSYKPKNVKSNFHNDNT